MGYKPKRWPSVMKANRDRAADNAAEAHVKTARLIKRMLDGETTISGIISDLRDIDRNLLVVLAALQAAGAEVDIA